jgi:putative endonuclease
MKQPCVYILANKPRGTLYIGVTSDLIARIWQHKNDLEKGFSGKYQTHFLVYYDMHATMLEAITREKQLKKWNRDWKIKLIEGVNENWDDLYGQITA